MKYLIFDIEHYYPGGGYEDYLTTVNSRKEVVNTIVDSIADKLNVYSVKDRYDLELRVEELKEEIEKLETLKERTERQESKLKDKKLYLEYSCEKLKEPITITIYNDYQIVLLKKKEIYTLESLEIEKAIDIENMYTNFKKIIKETEEEKSLYDIYEDMDKKKFINVDHIDKSIKLDKYATESFQEKE